jgi:sulfite reductase alpha subunit-like flavoprotein
MLAKQEEYAGLTAKRRRLGGVESETELKSIRPEEMSDGITPRTRARLLILYGSETGTAEDVAEMIGRESRRLLFDTRVMAMDTYASVLLPQSIFFRQ